jgi:malate/lactate dehydrogenase
VVSGSNPAEMFNDADVVVFIGGFPRKKGMERKDLLDMNKKIFIEQSKALSAAKKTVKCVVVANPANTNAYILSQFNPDIPKKNITCLTRLDHNRAISQLTLKTKSRP